MELSGGQKQRTAIGRAIVREPKLFLFDEPIAHLDAKLRARMRGELKIMQRRLGTTMIYVTHDQLEAMSMADRIAVMNNGVLQQFGTPQEIYNHPVNEWVAGFVGEPPMNFIDCDLIEEGGGFYAVHSAFKVAVPADQAAKLRGALKSSGVRMGIRPDQMAISLGQEGAAKGSIKITEPLGGDTLVDVDLKGAHHVLVKTDADFRGQMNNSCSLNFDTSRWHFFSKETGVAYF